MVRREAKFVECLFLNNFRNVKKISMQKKCFLKVILS